MRPLIVSLVMCWSAYADFISCPPLTAVVEAQPINADCPGLGAPILESSTVWTNDNIGVGDFDFNDMVFSLLRATDGFTATVLWLSGLRQSA